MSDIVNVNIMRHGDGKRVYVSVRTPTGEYVVNTDRISVYIDKLLPNVNDPDSQVSLRHGN